jgi:thioredoxin-dependent peroxiredoxin
MINRFTQGVAMFSRSIRISPLHAFISIAILTLVAFAVYAAAPTAEPAEGNSPKPKAGEVAPAIELPDQSGKTQKLADYKGKWVVLYFYPKDQTPGCTTQACEFRDDIFAFRKANAQILGVSVDDAASHKEFAEKHGLPFPLLADPTYVTAKRYGVLSKFNLPNGSSMTIASRDTFLIDPNGKVVKHYDVTPDKLAGHSKEVLADIENFKAAKG